MLDSEVVLLRVVVYSDFKEKNVTSFQSSKFKAFADVKINITRKFQFDLGRFEKILEKGENSGHMFDRVMSHF